MSMTAAQTPLLDSDFYRFQEQLTDQERDSLGRLREYLEREVAPIADAYWARAEFPEQVIAPLAELGMYGPGIPAVRQFENSAVYRGWAALELGRVDAGVATFIGVQSGLAMNSIAVAGSDEQQREWLPRMASG